MTNRAVAADMTIHTHVVVAANTGNPRLITISIRMGDRAKGDAERGPGRPRWPRKRASAGAECWI